MRKARKICVVTGSRAEYGLLFWLLREIQQDHDLELQLVVTGMHLAPEFGLTYRIIEEDGFCIEEKVDMLLSSDTPVGIAKSLGLGTISFADVFDRLKPDILVLLGDRYEILAAAQAALIANIPIAHLHGGEATEGAIDEAIRHSITKMSHLHFVAAEPYRKRVIQLGENPDRVINVGALGLDNIERLKLLERNEFEKSIQFKLGRVNFLVTYHPVTLGNHNPKYAIDQLLGALDDFPDAKVIFTRPNSDTNGRIIAQTIDEYAIKHPERVKVFTSLGQTKYLSAIKLTDVLIGNSSSGLIEVPVLGKPTVNLGDRQRGRLKTESVIDCQETKEEISASIRKALSPEFKILAKNVVSPYGKGGASVRIKEFLKDVELEGIIIKQFYDLQI
ncbi:UDP-N-acetylglucosamine 2-epimerase [Paradesulfitobacterium ferrireducens]|uniref:UDP-N-acetylglucosamine 2-epimerase n=1 Tax=Paradesulfitobacterium ferrireducens TaxID=2816476 RepID=UPI001A8EE0CA|nr:UDP-N-acetylglucosamine 2-epimerase [Paradesulfitobacterium ferrireducens]